jgi:hypothetical protein
MIARTLRLSGDKLGGNMHVARNVKDAGYFVAGRREKRNERLAAGLQAYRQLHGQL